MHMKVKNHLRGGMRVGVADGAGDFWGGAGESAAGESATGESAAGESAAGESATGESAVEASATGESAAEASATGESAAEASTPAESAAAASPGKSIPGRPPAISSVAFSTLFPLCLSTFNILFVIVSAASRSVEIWVVPLKLFVAEGGLKLLLLGLDL